MRLPLLPLLAVAVLGCRPDPGSPDYPDASDFGADTGTDSELPAGPDPFEEGDRRLSVGLFYEGGYSDIIEINDEDTHYYIYDSTYTQGVEINDVVEGREAAVFEHGSSGWFGGGVTWDVPKDMSEWDTLFVSLKSQDSSLAEIALHFIGGGEGIEQAADYGWVPDGRWHHLEIPLSAFPEANRAAVTGPFVIIGVDGVSGAELKIDNLYFTGEAN